MITVEKSDTWQSYLINGASRTEAANASIHVKPGCPDVLLAVQEGEIIARSFFTMAQAQEIARALLDAIGGTHAAACR